MSEEAIADSDFDMGAAQDEISSDLFGAEPEIEATDETEITSEAHPEATDEAPPEDQPEDTATEKIAPQSWKKEMHGFWGGLDPVVQDYIEQRENQMKEGLEKDRGDANLGRTMRDIMSPYSEMLQQQNVNEADAVKFLMNAHYRLSTQPEQRQQILSDLAKSYGVTFGPQQEVDPQIKALQDELTGLKSSITQSQQRSLQEAHDRVNKDVEAFASDHPFFDDVADDMVPFINSGMSLDEAYDKALWANSNTRQKELDRIQKENEDNLRKQAKKEAEEAKKAKSTNVKSRDTKNAPTGPLGTIEDTMNEVLQNIKNRT